MNGLFKFHFFVTFLSPATGHATNDPFAVLSAEGATRWHRHLSSPVPDGLGAHGVWHGDNA
jgi:hypothetical protein